MAIWIQLCEFSMRRVQEQTRKPTGVSRTGIVLSAIAVALVVGVVLVVNNLVDQSGRHVNTIKSLRVKYSKSAWKPHDDECLAQIERDLKNPNLKNANYSDLNLTKKALRLIGQIQSLERLDLSNCSFDNKDLVELQPSHVTTLLLRGTPLNDEGLKHLVKIKSISYLDIAEDKITEKGFKYLQELPNLQCLYANDVAVTPRSISYLAQLKNLDSLYFGYRLLDGEVVDALTKLESLVSLDMTGSTGVTPELISKMREMKKLGRLTLTQCEIDDKDLEAVATLPHLHSVFLKSNPFTEKGLKHLCKTKIMFLELTDCSNLSKEAVTEFRKAKPGCNVLYEGNRKTILERLDPQAQEYVDDIK